MTGLERSWSSSLWRYFTVQTAECQEVSRNLANTTRVSFTPQHPPVCFQGLVPSPLLLTLQHPAKWELFSLGSDLWQTSRQTKTSNVLRGKVNMQRMQVRDSENIQILAGELSERSFIVKYSVLNKVSRFLLSQLSCLCQKEPVEHNS